MRWYSLTPYLFSEFEGVRISSAVRFSGHGISDAQTKEMSLELNGFVVADFSLLLSNLLRNALGQSHLEEKMGGGEHIRIEQFCHS